MPTEPVPRRAVLYGPDHIEFGTVAIRSLRPTVAIALSRGEYPKGYAALDPNEDGVLASVSQDSVCLAVADGHNGFDVARVALEAIAAALPDLHAAADFDPGPALRATLTAARATLRSTRYDADRRHNDGGCALLIAVIGSDRLTLCSLGDAGAVLIRGRRVRRLVKPSPYFGTNADLKTFRITRRRGKAADVVILGTDGLFTFLGDRPADALRRTRTAPDAADAAADLVAEAFAGGAGDNIATAVAVLSP